MHALDDRRHFVPPFRPAQGSLCATATSFKRKEEGTSARADVEAKRQEVACATIPPATVLGGDFADVACLARDLPRVLCLALLLSLSALCGPGHAAMMPQHRV